MDKPSAGKAPFLLNVDEKQRLVTFVPRGLWRAEDAQGMVEGFRQCHKIMSGGGRWFLLVDARLWATQSAEIQEAVVRCMEENRRAGLRRSARVVDPSVIKLQLDRLGLRSPLERQDFTDETEALAWLLRPVDTE